MRATMDLLGLYLADNTILDDLQLPEDLDADVVKDNLLAETAELEILYSDADFMKEMIKIWSKKQLHVWNELYATLLYDYNPIWNKDGKKTETRNLAGSDTFSHNYTDNENRNFGGSAQTTGGTKVSDSVYAFNSSTAAPESDTDTTINTTVATTDTGTGSHTVTEGSTRGTTDTGTLTTVEQGNIGVTSTQSLIKEQREVVQFNVIDYIIADFKKRFCLMIY